MIVLVEGLGPLRPAVLLVRRTSCPDGVLDVVDMVLFLTVLAGVCLDARPADLRGGVLDADGANAGCLRRGGSDEPALEDAPACLESTARFGLEDGVEVLDFDIAGFDVAGLLDPEEEEAASPVVDPRLMLSSR